MAEAAAAAIVEYAGVELATAQFIVAAVQVVTAVYTLREQQQRAQRAARARQQDSQRDRYTMVRSAVEPRTLVLGRQRVSGPLAYIGSYGANREKLVFVVLLAAHEIDGFEQIYFDDELVTLDGSGNVTAVNRRDQFSITTASDTFTLTSEPDAATVVATVAYGSTTVTLSTSVSGSSVTVSGATAGQTGTVTITYRPKQSPFVAVTTNIGQASITLDGSGNGSVTLPYTPTAGSVTVTGIVGTGDSAEQRDITSFSSVSGAVVTVTGWTGGASTWTVGYQYETTSSRARVRTYTGAPGQTADAGMIAALPGIWTSAHTMTGLAYMVVECDYDPNAFPDGLVNASAVVRGAKVYDPRTGRTEWINAGAPTTGPHPGENPALLTRHVATHQLSGRLPVSAVNDPSIVAAANVCDTSTAYVVDGKTYTRPLYTAGLVVRSGTRPKDSIDDLVTAMAGRWVFVDGQLRVRAGAFVTPLQTLDETWLTTTQGVRYQARNNRSDVFNTVTGTFIDAARDYRQLPYEDVESATFIAEDGQPLESDMPLNAVTFGGQAQQVAAALMREARYGERLTVACNMRAYPVEVFDVLYVNLSRWGMVGETYEVIDVGMSLDGGILLSLKRTAPEVWAVGLSFPATPLAPNTRFASPFVVPDVQSLGLASGSANLLRQQDGTVQTRLKVSFTAPTDALVVEGGGTEVRYGPASLPESSWQSVRATSNQNELWLTNVQDGGLYLVMARHFNSLVDGRWTLPSLHKVSGKSAAPSNVSTFAGTVSKGRISWTWVPPTDADYSATELRTANSNWGSTSTPPVFRGKASAFQQIVTATGSYTLYARHIDSSGNTSATSASATVVVAAGDLVQDGAPGTAGTSVFTATIYQQSASAPSAPTGGTFNFGTATLTPPSGWSAAQPAVSSTPTYSTTYTFSTGTPGATVTAGTWGTPVLVAQVGTSGPTVPGPLPTSANGTASPTTCVSGVRFLTAGDVARKASGTSSTYNNYTKWFNPTGGTPGNSYWIKFRTREVVNTAGSVTVGGATNTWQALSSDRTVTLTATAGADGTALVDYWIAADSAGDSIVSSGVIDLQASST